MASWDSNVGLWTPQAQGCPSREMPSAVTVGVGPQRATMGRFPSGEVIRKEGRRPGSLTGCNPHTRQEPGPQHSLHVQGQGMAPKSTNFNNQETLW